MGGEQTVTIYIRLRNLALKQLKKMNTQVKTSTLLWRAFKFAAGTAIGIVTRQIRIMRQALNRYGKYLILIGAYIMVRWAKKSVSAIIAVGSKYEQLYNRILVASRGLRADADRTWAKVLKFAAESPLMTEPVVAAFATLKAAGVEGAFEVTKSLSGLALMFNREVDDLAGMFLGALQRVFRRMGIIIDRSGKKAIIQTAMWTEVVGKDIREVWKGLAKVIDKSFGDALDIMRNTWSGVTKEMMGKWDVFLNRIARAGSLDYLISVVKVINKEFDRLANTGKLEEAAEKISGWLEHIFKTGSKVVILFTRWKQGFLAIKLVATVVLGIFNAMVFGPMNMANKFILLILKGIRKIFQLLDKSGKVWGNIIEKMVEHKEFLGLGDAAVDFLDSVSKGLLSIGETPGLDKLIGEYETLGNILSELVLDPWEEVNKILKEITAVEKEIVALEKLHGDYTKQIAEERKKLLALRIQEAAQSDKIRQNLAITARYEQISKRVLTEINALVKEQKDLRSSMLGMGDEEVARMQYISDNWKEIAKDAMAGKTRGKEWLDAITAWSELSGRGGAVVEKLRQDFFAPLVESLKRAFPPTLADPGYRTPEERLDKKRAELIGSRVQAEKDVIGSSKWMVENLKLDLESHFGENVTIVMDAEVDKFAKELKVVRDSMIQDMLDILKGEKDVDRMGLRSGEAEADAIVGMP